MPLFLMIAGVILMVTGGIAIYFLGGLWLGGFEHFITQQHFIEYGLPYGLFPLLAGASFLSWGMRMRKSRRRQFASPVQKSGLSDNK